jgi:hypothetical protein
MIAKLEEDGERGCAWRRHDGLPGSCGGIIPVRSGHMPVKSGWSRGCHRGSAVAGEQLQSLSIGCGLGDSALRREKDSER